MHYLDGLKGCGQDLEQNMQQTVIHIIRHLLRLMKTCTTASQFESLLAAMKWRFSGSDYQALASLDLFSALKSGSENI